MYPTPTVQDILGSPLHFPDAFKKWLLDYFATNVPQIPFKQVAGAQDYLFKAANSPPRRSPRPPPPPRTRGRARWTTWHPTRTTPYWWEVFSKAPTRWSP